MISLSTIRTCHKSAQGYAWVESYREKWWFTGLWEEGLTLWWREDWAGLGNILREVGGLWCCATRHSPDTMLHWCFLPSTLYIHIYMSSWNPLCLLNVSVGCCAGINRKSWILMLAEFLALSVSDDASQPRQNLLLSWVRRHFDSLILQICI